MRRVNSVADGQTEVERLARRRQVGEPEQAVRVNCDEKTEGRESVGQMKRGHAARGQKQRFFPRTCRQQTHP